MTTLSQGIVCALLLMFFATSSQSPASDPRTAPNIVDAGKAPRFKLRYRPKPGAIVRLEQTTRVDQRLEHNGAVIDRRPAPTWKIVMTNRVESVNGRGEIEMSLTYDEVSILEQGQMTDAQRDDLLEKARGLAFRAMIRCTARGEVLSLDIQTAPDADPSLKQLFEGMGDGILTLVHAFPEEPVGEGAAWTSDRGLVGAGAGSTRFTIDSMRAGKVKIIANSEGSVPGGPTPDPSDPKRVQVLERIVTGDQATTLSVQHPGSVEQSTTTRIVTKMQGPGRDGKLVPIDKIIETTSNIRVVD